MVNSGGVGEAGEDQGRCEVNSRNLGEGSGTETFHKTLIWSNISQISELYNSTVISS